MHATVRHYTGSAGFADALVERQADVRSVLQGVDGFRAYYLIRVSDDEAITVGIFDDAAGGEESTRRAAEWVKENLSGLSVQAPHVSSGEVAIQF